MQKWDKHNRIVLETEADHELALERRPGPSPQLYLRCTCDTYLNALHNHGFHNSDRHCEHMTWWRTTGQQKVAVMLPDAWRSDKINWGHNTLGVVTAFNAFIPGLDKNAPQNITIISDGAPIWSQPNTKAPSQIIAELPLGCRVQLLGRGKEYSHMLAVRFKSAETMDWGWVHYTVVNLSVAPYAVPGLEVYAAKHPTAAVPAKKAKLGPLAPSTLAELPIKLVKVIPTEHQIRTAPDSMGEHLATVNKGDALRVIGHYDSGGWAAVRWQTENDAFGNLHEALGWIQFTALALTQGDFFKLPALTYAGQLTIQPSAQPAKAPAKKKAKKTAAAPPADASSPAAPPIPAHPRLELDFDEDPT